MKILSRYSLAAVALIAIFARTAQATSVFSDSFTYPDGNLVGQGGWSQTAADASNPIQVTSGHAVLDTPGQDAYRPFTSAIPNTPGGSLFTAMDLTVTSADNGGYVVALSDPVGTTINFYERLFVRAATGGYNLGIQDFTNTGIFPTYASGPSAVLLLNHSYHVVVAWNFVSGPLNDTLSVYVDPTSPTEGLNTPYVTRTWLSTNAEPAQLSAVNLNQGPSGPAPNALVDNLTVATSFAEVVPEPFTGQLFTLGLLLCAAGQLSRLRRTAATAGWGTLWV